MDEVQAFIARNKHQYGYIMQEASRQWIKENPTGALTVGPCNIFIEKYGDYHALQDKVERYEKALAKITQIGFVRADLDDVDYDFSPQGHSDCMDIALEALRE